MIHIFANFHHFFLSSWEFGMDEIESFTFDFMNEFFDAWFADVDVDVNVDDSFVDVVWCSYWSKLKDACCENVKPGDVADVINGWYLIEFKVWDGA